MPVSMRGRKASLFHFLPFAALALGALIGCRPGAAPVDRPAPGQVQLADTDRVLVLAPHPDDEVLGTGGVLSEAVRRGIPTRVVFLTNGDSNEWSFLVYHKRPVFLPQGALAMGLVRQRARPWRPPRRWACRPGT